MAGDILQHHDSVIHHEAGGDGQAISDRLLRLKPHKYIAAKVPIKETGTATAGISVARPERRNRNTTRITSATEITSVCSTSSSEARMVGERSGDLQVDSRRNGLLQLRQAGADAVHRLDNIGFRQFADHQQDRRFGVGHPGVAYVLHRIRDGGDISQPHRGAILVVDDQRLIVGGGLQLIVGLHLPAVRAVLQRPCGLRTLASLMAVRTASSDTPG